MALDQAGYPHISTGPYFIAVDRIRTLPQYLQFKISYNRQLVYLQDLKDFFFGTLQGKVYKYDDEDLVRLGFVLRHGVLRKEQDPPDPLQNHPPRNERPSFEVESDDQEDFTSNSEASIDDAYYPFSRVPSIASTAMGISGSQTATESPIVSLCHACLLRNQC